MDDATWYLDSDDSSPLGSPSTPPTLNGEYLCLPYRSGLTLSAGIWGDFEKPAGREGIPPLELSLKTREPKPKPHRSRTWSPGHQFRPPDSHKEDLPEASGFWRLALRLRTFAALGRL